MKDNTRVIAALLIGAAAGAALGLLFAPSKGEELRGDLAGYIDDIIDGAKEKAMSAVNSAKDYGSNMYDKAKTRFSGVAEELNEQKDRVVDDARSKGRELKHEAQRRAGEAKAHMRNGSNEVNEAVQKA